MPLVFAVATLAGGETSLIRATGVSRRLLNGSPTFPSIKLSRHQSCLALSSHSRGPSQSDLGFVTSSTQFVGLSSRTSLNQCCAKSVKIFSRDNGDARRPLLHLAALFEVVTLLWRASTVLLRRIPYMYCSICFSRGTNEACRSHCRSHIALRMCHRDMVADSAL